MEIGFVSFNQETLNRTSRLMKLLQGQGAIDELGLGRIRDAFSNKMFPGLSTLQTHAKYFLLMPALYSFLEKSRIQDARDARSKIREFEISLTDRLLEGTPQDKAKGIIGGESRQKGGGYVKYDPAYIYQAGLETYGLVKSGGNLYAMIAERAAAHANMPKKYHGSEETDGDAEELNGNRQVFYPCGEKYGFRDKYPLSIELTQKEAEFLKNRIIAHTPGSLLHYFLDSGLYKEAVDHEYFETLIQVLEGRVPEELFKTYLLARRYARFARLLRMRYAFLYDRAVEAEKTLQEEQNFFDYLKKHRSEFSPEAIEEILQFVTPMVTEDTCKTFCRKAARLIDESDWEGLDELIVKREVEIKTLRRSKLMNAADFEKGKPFESPGLMAFRWNTIVRTVLREIKEGLGE